MFSISLFAVVLGASAIWLVPLFVFAAMLLLLATAVFFIVRATLKKEKQRRAAIPKLSRMGFQLDPSSTTAPDFPFDAFTQDDFETDFGITVPGTRDTAFHFQYSVEINDESRTRRRSCAIVPIPFEAPPIAIWRGGRSLFGVLGGRRIDTDSPAFNAMYEVSCADERFAYTALGYELIEWLLNAPPIMNDTTIEMNGPWMMLRRQQIPDLALVDLLRHADSLRSALPPVLTSLYRGSGPVSPHPDVSPQHETGDG